MDSGVEELQACIIKATSVRQSALGVFGLFLGVFDGFLLLVGVLCIMLCILLIVLILLAEILGNRLVLLVFFLHQSALLVLGSLLITLLITFLTQKRDEA